MSAANAKFLKLSQKISSLNVQLEKEKQLQSEHLETRYKSIESRFNNFQSRQIQRYSGLRNRIANLSKLVDEERHEGSKMADKKLR